MPRIWLSRKDEPGNSPTPNIFLESFPFKSTCNFPPLWKIWANLKMVFLRYEFLKKGGFSDFPAFPRYLDQFCRRHSIEWEILRHKCILDIFLEHLGLGVLKISSHAKNNVKNMKNLKNLQRALWIFMAEILQTTLKKV